MKQNRFIALVYKEFLQIIRDPSSLLIAFILPLILLFIFGYGVSLDLRATKIGIVVEQPSAFTNDLVAGFQHSSFFDAHIGYDIRQFTDLITTGKLKSIIVIPAEFEQNIHAGNPANIQIIIDGAEPNTASLVKNYAQGVISTWSATLNQTKPPLIQIQPRFWFNPELTSKYFLVPGSIAIVMALVGTLLTSLVVAREWERGTMEAMMATPVTAIELLAGKLIPYFLLGLISMTVCLILALYLFQIPFRGSFFALYAIASAFLIPALGQGLLISAVSKNQFIASQVALLSGFLPAVLLSGFVFDIASMPKWIQWLTYIVPARYLIPCLQTVFLAGDIWPMFLSNIAIMLFIGFIMFILAAKNTRKRIV